MEWRVGVREADGHTCPAEDLVPNLARERASGKKVVHGLLLLVTQGASVIVVQSEASQAFRGPATVLHGQPKEELDAERSPRSPGEPPERVFTSSKEYGLAAGACSVCSRRGPTPA